MNWVRARAEQNVGESPAVVMEEIDGVTGWPGRACCCPAKPVVKILLPVLRDDKIHIVDLYLCGHHYQKSFGTLVDAGATTISRYREMAGALP